MNSMNEKQLEELILSKSPERAVFEALGLNNIKAGGQVAVVDDPTFPRPGLKGRVVGPVPEGHSGTVEVEFADGTKSHLQINQLIPVQGAGSASRAAA